MLYFPDRESERKGWKSGGMEGKGEKGGGKGKGKKRQREEK